MHENSTICTTVSARLLPWLWILVLILAARADDSCTCDAAKLSNSWCEPCKVGYVAALRIPSPILFEVLDAHGHKVSFENMHCQSCKEAYKGGGFCKRHRVGFVGDLAFFSRLTYYLAQGKSQEMTQITCKTCQKNSSSQGWCQTCGIGRVGNVLFKEQEIQAKAAKEYLLLLAAVAKLADCEMCAAALFAGSRCPWCKISYKRESNAPEKLKPAEKPTEKPAEKPTEKPQSP